MLHQCLKKPPPSREGFLIACFFVDRYHKDHTSVKLTTQKDPQVLDLCNHQQT